MMIEENAVEKGRRSLARLQKQKKPGITGLRLVIELAPDIHARLAEGHRLKEVWSAIVEPLPEDEKLTLPTFRKYWQTARTETGLAPLKRWTKTTKAKKSGAASETGKPVSSSDFIEDPDHI